jgi:hypothetical protein
LSRLGSAGEPVAGLLCAGNAGSNTATDHIEVFDTALTQLPASLREPDEHRYRPVLVHTDAAGAIPAYQVVRASRAGEHCSVIEPREGTWITEANFKAQRTGQRGTN